MTREIILRSARGVVQGTTLVDDADYTTLAQRRWRLTPEGYAYRTVREGEQTWAVPMHRLILGLERGDKREVDHINRDRLDNRRSNLRIATRAQNCQNLPAIGRSRFRGVYWNKRQRAWHARARINNKVFHLGYFKREEDAADAAAAFRAEHMPFSQEAQAA